MVKSSKRKYDPSQLAPAESSMGSMAFPTQNTIDEEIERLRRLQEHIKKMELFNFDWFSKGEVVGLLNRLNNEDLAEDSGLEDYQPEPLKNPLVDSWVKITEGSSSSSFNHTFTVMDNPDGPKQFRLETTLVYDLSQFFIPREGRWFLFFPASKGIVAAFEFPDNKPVYAYVKSYVDYQYGVPDKRHKTPSWAFSYARYNWTYGSPKGRFFLSHVHPSRLKSLTLKGTIHRQYMAKEKEGQKRTEKEDDKIEIDWNMYDSTMGKVTGDEGIKVIHGGIVYYWNKMSGAYRDFNFFQGKRNKYDFPFEGENVAYLKLPYLTSVRWKEDEGNWKTTYQCKNDLKITTPTGVKPLTNLQFGGWEGTNIHYSDSMNGYVGFTNIWAEPSVTYSISQESWGEPTSKDTFGDMGVLFGKHTGIWEAAKKGRDWKDNYWQSNPSALDAAKMALNCGNGYTMSDFLSKYARGGIDFERKGWTTYGNYTSSCMNVFNPRIYQSKESVGLLNFRVL